jgi:hypothetical protein
MAAKNGSDSHRVGNRLPEISEIDFPTWDMLFSAILMRYPGVYEAFEVEVSEDETIEQKEIRIKTHGKGNKKAYSYLSDAVMGNKTAVLIMRKVISRDKEIWANSIMKELKLRFSKHAADVLQKLISEFNSLTMIVGETTETFLDRVFEKVNCISEIEETETPTEAQIMSRVKEGLKFAHPTFFDLLELVELDYKNFISKVEKYNKPSLLVVERVVLEKEIVPSANFSSDYRNKAQGSDQNWKSEQRKCYACDSTKHLLHDCKFRDEYLESQRNHQRAEASYKRPEKRQDSPHLKGILRRKSDNDGSSKTKHSKYFMNEEGDWNSDNI